MKIRMRLDVWSSHGCFLGFSSEDASRLWTKTRFSVSKDIYNLKDSKTELFQVKNISETKRQLASQAYNHTESFVQKIHPPGDSKWPFDPVFGGHLTIPKRSQRITIHVFCSILDFIDFYGDFGGEPGIYVDLIWLDDIYEPITSSAPKPLASWHDQGMED